MANQLDGSKRSNQIYGLDSIRYLREEDAADIFGLPYSTVLCFAQAAGAVYQLPKITLIHRKQMEKYMTFSNRFCEYSVLVNGAIASSPDMEQLAEYIREIP